MDYFDEPGEIYCFFCSDPNCKNNECLQDGMMGLTPEHHGELNKHNTSRERFAELRQQYADDKRALQQIDIYDPETEYHAKIKRYFTACKANDTEAMAELEAWFDWYYPDVKKG